MKTKIVILLIFLFNSYSTFCQSFKKEQLKYERVRNAFDDKWDNLSKSLAEISIESNDYKIFIRAFKLDKKLEVWVSKLSSEKFKLFKVYNIAASSGNLGPKRKEGDYQVPEGFYKIERFNPFSDYHLSLGINYPNSADKILGDKKLGGDIYIHGSNVTIGCIPITNDKIEELYILAVQAKNNGQKNIYVHIFPFDFDKNQLSLFAKNPNYNFWQNLNEGYSKFNKTKQIPYIEIDKNGKYNVK